MSSNFKTSRIKHKSCINSGAIFTGINSYSHSNSFCPRLRYRGWHCEDLLSTQCIIQVFLNHSTDLFKAKFIPTLLLNHQNNKHSRCCVLRILWKSFAAPFASKTLQAGLNSTSMQIFDCFRLFLLLIRDTYCYILRL